MNRRILLLCFGIFVLLFLSILVIGPDHLLNKPDEVSTSREKNSNGAVTPDEEAHPSRSRERPLRSRSQPTTHSVAELAHFHLPKFTLENASLKSSIELLNAQYLQVCSETKETGHIFEWEIEGHSSQIKKLTLQGDFFTCCRLIATYSGTTFHRNKTHLTFREIPDGPRQKKTHLVPPDFQSTLAAILNDEANKEDRDDPFALNPPPPKFDLNTILTEAGFLKPGESVDYDPVSSKLTTQAGVHNSTRLEGLMNSLLSRTPTQVRINLQSFVGEDVMAIPSIVVRPGQPGTIEIGKELLLPGKEGILNQFIGTRIEVSNELYGLGERNTVSYTQTEDPTPESLIAYTRTMQTEDLDFNRFEIKDYVATETLEQRLEDSALELSSEDTEGMSRRFLLSSQRLNAIGEAVEP